MHSQSDKMNQVPVIGPSLLEERGEGIHFETRLINGDYNWQLNACQGYEVHVRGSVEILWERFERK